MKQQDLDEHSVQVENLKAGIREISHEINNPLGVMRMAAYFLEVTNPPEDKKTHYFKVLNESIDKIEKCLEQLKILRENPSAASVHPPLQDT
ncbi:MAG TPA: histidine kinase dimerization/phospho-acceptor domain-containing protein [Bacteroidota bacterium]|nr:histidine kinase dimerization/phospho-acceptor domain-containing protein [Bacteroidota bacterium]